MSYRRLAWTTDSGELRPLQRAGRSGPVTIRQGCRLTDSRRHGIKIYRGAEIQNTCARRYRSQADRGFCEGLDALSVYETAPIDSCSFYKTREFTTPEALPQSEFTPCDVGFSWERNRVRTPDDRRQAAVDVTKGDTLPESFSVGENVWFRLQFTIPESMAGHPVFLNFVIDPVGDAEGAHGPTSRMPLLP